MNAKLLLLILASFFCTSGFASLETGAGAKTTSAITDGGVYRIEAGICYRDGKIVAFKNCRKPKNGWDRERLTICIDPSKSKGDFPGLTEQLWMCTGNGEVYQGGKFQQNNCYNECLKYFMQNGIG